jgi:hypothetical protein
VFTNQQGKNRLHSQQQGGYYPEKSGVTGIGFLSLIAGLAG